MEIKLAICTPHTGTIKTKTTFSLIRMLKKFPHDYNFLEVEGSVLHHNREYLAQTAIELKSTHLLFVDSDMVFPEDALSRLLSRDKDIIGSTANGRGMGVFAGFAPTTTHKIKDGEITINEKHGDLLKCTGVGTGFMLIRIEVFKKLKQPWFFWESNEKGELVTGEDMWFCRKARESGFDIWCDTSIKMGHIGDYIY